MKALQPDNGFQNHYVKNMTISIESRKSLKKDLQYKKYKFLIQLESEMDFQYETVRKAFRQARN